MSKPCHTTLGFTEIITSSILLKYPTLLKINVRKYIS